MSISPLALISELVMVDHGKYIVKVSAQSNNLILGTGLAGAETVEKAEDQARQRAIEVINWTANLTPLRKKDQEIVNQNLSSSNSSISSEVNSTVAEESKVKPIAHEPKKVSISSTHLPSISEQKRPPKVSESMVEKNENQQLPVIPSETSPAKIISDPTVNSSITFDHQPSEIINSQNVSPATHSEPAEVNNSQSQINFTTPEENLLPIDNSTNSNQKASAKIEKEAETYPSRELSETMDFSQIIDQTSIELKRLGWTQEDGKKYLLETYGKKSRHLLSDEELIEFLRYLKQQSI